MTPKELKQLAKACRDAGIKHYKNGEIEFTLSDDAPVSNYKKRTAPILSGPVAPDTDVEALTYEQKLFWSTGGDEEESTEQ